MRRGYWVHQNCRDMFIEVLKSYNVHTDYIKIKYRCWNKGYTNDPWMITPSIFKAKVMKKDLINWSSYVEN